MLYNLYQILGAVLYSLLVIASPLFARCLPHWQLPRRFGRYSGVHQVTQRTAASGRKQLVWIHAASVGEVQAAQALLAVLMDTLSEVEIFLTTMTRQGRAVARSLLPAHVRCELAPLDTPQAVKRALKEVQPALYICLETELWPVMLTEMRRAEVPMLLLNGRISERSFSRYLRIKGTVLELLAGFSKVAVIREQDRERFRRLGLSADRVQVCGNMKYDLIKRNQETGAPEQMREKYARQLAVQPGETVFICGSTRTGEEELLLPVYTRLREKTAAGLLWIIAPRHLERLPVVTALLDRAGLGYEMFSQCTKGSGKGRQEDIILLDSMGKLAELYAVGDYVFCGGSLVNKGGHNIMEPIGWRKPVFFGSFMQDFQDAVDLILAAGAGVQVDSPGDLANYLLSHPLGSPVYEQLGQAADRLARTQQGAVERQAKIVIQALGGADG